MPREIFFILAVWRSSPGRNAQKKARLRKARRLLIVPFKTKLLEYNYLDELCPRPGHTRISMRYSINVN